MRNLLLGLAILAVLVPYGQADSGPCTGGGNFTPVTFASEKITVSSTALGFTVATFAPSGSPAAMQAYCSVEDDAVRFLTTGVAPTATTGILVATGSYITVCQEDIRRFRVIRVTADAELNCEYFRGPQ